MTTILDAKIQWTTSFEPRLDPTPGEWSIIACIRPRTHDTLVHVTAPDGQDVLDLTDPVDERDGALAAGERARAIASALVEAAPLAWGQGQYWRDFEDGAGAVSPFVQADFDQARRQAWELLKRHFQGEAIPGQNWKAPYARFAEWFEACSRSGLYAVASL